MAERRMFSKTIVDSDEFLDLPLSTQALYFHLGMRADDDGFLNNAQKIVRMINAEKSDYELLVKKEFIITFDRGVCVLRHWKIHNYIRNDRYKPTPYYEEANSLVLNRNKSYSKKDGIPSDTQVDTQDSLDENNIDKDKLNNFKTRNCTEDLNEIEEDDEDKIKVINGIKQNENFECNNEIALNNKSQDIQNIEYEKKKVYKSECKDISEDDNKYVVEDAENTKDISKCESKEKIEDLGKAKANYELSEIEIFKIKEAWNKLKVNNIICIKNDRLKLLNERISEYGTNNIYKAFDLVDKSKFLKGENDKGWSITFDWLLKNNNLLKVLEGRYSDCNNGNVSKSLNNSRGFNNFQPRNYDYECLEKALLGWEVVPKNRIFK